MAGSPDCLFCKIIEGKIPAQIIAQDDLVVAFADINPQAPHHILICPRAHLATLDEVAPEHEALMGRVVRTASHIARERGLVAPGYRLVSNCGAGAGQSVFHIHFHLLGGRAFHWPPG